MCLPRLGMTVGNARSVDRFSGAPRPTGLDARRRLVPTPPAESFAWPPPENRQSAPMSDQTETTAKAGAIIVPVTLFEQNCTILWDEPSKKAVVFDPGGDVPKILEAVRQTGVS